MHFFTLDSDDYVDSYPTWGKLAVADEVCDPFCCTSFWQLAFHEAFNPRRRLLIEDTPNGVVAFAEKVFPSGRTILTPIEALWFFGCPVLGFDGLDLLEAVMRFAASAYAPGFPEILLGGLRSDGSLLPRIRRRFAPHFEFRMHAPGQEVQCAASLAGGVDGFLSRRPAHLRKNLRNAERKAKAADIRFLRLLPQTLDEADAIYSRMLAVEERSWKGLNDCGMTNPPALEFYRAMLRRLALVGAARVILARAGEQDIGFIFGGLCEGIYRGQQFSFDDAWARFSVGSLMQMEQVRWLCEEGVRRYDLGPLLSRRMGYKRHWTELGFPVSSWFLIKK
ncbi:MAG: GNAT family N-acetyltransferase [Candidatus Accumulibacter sp.]|jgi:hypothetical protein|nr:GNAT family N-acetyltransferase [Accumulibacter sp.]